MDWISEFLKFVLHIDTYLNVILQQYGVWTYLFLFMIIFLETGFVVTPFLPGDSLLFVAGAFSASGALNIWIVYPLILLAAFIGDNLNYWVGHKIGNAVYKKEYRYIKREYVEKTRHFYEKYGTKAVIIARFVPIVRTFAPFIAGVGEMRYPKFLLYSVIASLLWTTVFVLGGYFFGNISIVRENFTIVLLVIIGSSLIPPIYEYIKHRRQANALQK